MIRAILVTHGSLGQSLFDAAESVLGPQSGASVLSNKGLSLEQIQSRVRELLTDEPTIIMVDLCGGSPYMACCALSNLPGETQIVSGVNLPMLLSYFTKRDKLSLSELSETVERDAMRGIQNRQNA
jgi:PTS system mannose-specific IIA component